MNETAIQRRSTTEEVQRSADQAAEMQLRAWIMRGIQGLISGLGIKHRLPASLGFDLGLDTLGEPIRAHLVPGQIDDVALVVAGVHGSEQSGVEVADRLLQQLQVHRPFFTVVVVPRLFPDNVAGRAAWEAKLAADQGTIAVKKYRDLRNKADDPGRITPGKGMKDPNRQFPELGADLDLAKPLDAKGRPVEPGNLALLALIKAFSPTRLVSIHAQKDLKKAGVFADPHPSVLPGALATEADQVAIATAKRAEALGAKVAGNTRTAGWSSLYPGQDPVLSAEKMKAENARGRSLGQWGPSKGIAVLTVEVAEQYTSSGAVDDPQRAGELEAHATALREVFLGPSPTGGAVPASTGSSPATPAQVRPPTAGATSVPVQRIVLARVAAEAGNRAATAAVGQMRNPHPGSLPTLTPPIGTATPPIGTAPDHLGVQRAGLLGGFGDAVLGAASAVAGGAVGAITGMAGGVRDVSLGLPVERALIKRLVISGVESRTLARLILTMRHPDTLGRPLTRGRRADKALLRELDQIRKKIIEPAIERYRPEATLTPDELARKVRRATKQAESGGDEGARTQLAADIKKVTGKPADTWFAGHVATARFLGVPIGPSSGSAVGGVHQEMLTKLDDAGKKLAAHPDFAGRTGVEIADAIGMDGLGGLRPPKLASGGERPSLHCYGLAVDINYSTNPFVGLNGPAVPNLVHRATMLLQGESYHIERPPPDDRTVLEQWVKTHLASSNVVAYLNMDEAALNAQLSAMLAINPAAPAKMRKLSWWVAQQKQDRALRGKGDLVGRDPRETGIMNLDHRLVAALTDAGLTWGGMYKGAKDLMHFDDRSRFRR